MRLWAVIARAIFLLCWCASAWAQSASEGEIEGTVIDPAGAAIPGVSLVARELETSARYRAATDERGRFHFLVLPAGTYELTLEHPGFATLIQRGIVVSVGARINLPISLHLATPSQSLEVKAEAPLVETSRSQMSFTIDGKAIDGLPVNGRNYMSFLVLSPGVIYDTSSETPSLGGQRSLNLMLVDGVNDNNPLGGDSFLNLPHQFSLEVVQEFQVNVGGYSAELGRAANGVVSTITKSGTNEFHGDLFWYFRDQGLNATDLIRKNNGDPKDPLHVHQFGAAFGGPLIKDKLFFFAAYDGQRRKLQNLTFLNLPGNFTLSPVPAVAAYQQLALDYLKPRAVSYIQTFDEDPIFAKIDWQVSPRNRLTARWNGLDFRNDNGRNSGPQNSFEHTGDAPSTNQAVDVSLVSSISPSRVNELRFSYLDNDQRGGVNSANPQAQVFEGGQLVLTVGRVVNDPIDNYFHQFGAADTLTLSKGAHAIKFGGEVLISRSTATSAPSFSGNYRFNSLESFGRSLAGTPVPQPGETYTQSFSGQGVPGVVVHPNSTEVSAFIQDEWRVRPSLTVNFGLRYDIQVMAQPPVRNPALFAARLDTSFVPLDGNNFGPRLGLAWNPLSSHRLVVRGGYGIYFTWLRGLMAARAHYQNGISVQTRTFTGASIPAYPNNLCGPPDPAGVSPSCPPPNAGIDSIMLISPDYVQPYDQHASLGTEYQLQKNLSVSASYLMVKGTHLQRWRDINLSAPLAAAIGIANTSTVLSYFRFSSIRPIAGFGRILALESAGNSSYNALIVQANKRFSDNFQFLAAYTMGKVIDDRPEALIFNPGSGLESALLSNPYDPWMDRGPGAVDARQRFVASGVWRLDYANGLRPAARAILGGWELSGILSVQSGLPYSGLVNFDLNNDGNPFSDRTPGLSRDTFRLPTIVSLDPRVTRNITLVRDRVHMQLMCEAFNVFNSANVTNVRSTQYSRSTSALACGIAGAPCLVPQNTGPSAFGAPVDTSGPRILQVAARILF